MKMLAENEGKNPDTPVVLRDRATDQCATAQEGATVQPQKSAIAHPGATALPTPSATAQRSATALPNLSAAANSDWDGSISPVHPNASTTPPHSSTTPITIIPPFPYAYLTKDLVDKSLFRIVSILKEVRINIPFIVAILQMPKFVKFFKEIFSNKKTWDENETLCLTENCSAILLNKMPRKLEDPGSLTIPCKIGPLSFERVLCDSGASINLMPYSVFKKLRLGEPKPTSMRLKFADLSIKSPRGILEDVIVKVDEFYFPVDFAVLDIDEDVEVPLILGRPFLATGRAIIDVAGGKLTLNVGDEKITFDVPKAPQHSNAHKSCFRVDIIDFGANENFQENKVDDPVKLSLSLSRDAIPVGHTELEAIQGNQEQQVAKMLEEVRTIHEWELEGNGGVNPGKCIHRTRMMGLADPIVQDRCTAIDLVSHREKCHLMIQEGIGVRHTMYMECDDQGYGMENYKRTDLRQDEVSPQFRDPSN